MRMANLIRGKLRAAFWYLANSINFRPLLSIHCGCHPVKYYFIIKVIWQR